MEVTANQVLSGMQPKKKQLNPKEFALAMQEERRKALGSDTSGAGGTPSKSSSAATKMMKLEAESTMFTTQELFVPCLQAARYVHSRPPAIAELIGGSPLPTTTASVTATPAQGYIPCVLADGSKGYLYKRSADSSSAKEARATSSLSSPLPLSARSPASATTAGGLVSCINPPVKTTLLSKPMSELMQEADALKVKALLLKDALMAERTERAERAERVMESDGPALFQASSDAHVEIEAVAGT